MASGMMLRAARATRTALAGVPPPPGALAAAPAAARGFAGGHGTGVVHAGLELQPAAKWHVYWGQGLAGLMWFWVFYRAKHDGATLLYGHAPHFEHDDEH